MVETSVVARAARPGERMATVVPIRICPAPRRFRAPRGDAGSAGTRSRGWGGSFKSARTVLMSDSAAGFWQSLMTLTYGASSLVGVACEVAVLIAISTIVRRNRPDAFRGLQLWAILSLVVMVFLT